MEKRKDGGKIEGNLFFLLLWCLWNAGICPRHHWSQAANLLIIAAKGWRCDLNSYFKFGADLWELQRRESRGTDEVLASNIHNVTHSCSAGELRSDCSHNAGGQQLRLNHRALFSPSTAEWSKDTITQTRKKDHQRESLTLMLWETIRIHLKWLLLAC